jgi:hypothetical protein
MFEKDKHYPIVWVSLMLLNGHPRYYHGRYSTFMRATDNPEHDTIYVDLLFPFHHLAVLNTKQPFDPSQLRIIEEHGYRILWIDWESDTPENLLAQVITALRKCPVAPENREQA